MTIDTTDKKTNDMAPQELQWHPMGASKPGVGQYNGRDSMIEDWQRSLDDFEGSSYPSLSPSAGQPLVVERVVHQFHMANRQNTTSSSLIRAAWALIAGQLTHSNDVMFGTDVFRCNVLQNVDTPTPTNATTIPIRIKFTLDQKVVDYLNAVQQQELSMMSFCNDDLQQITEIWSESRQASMFQTLLLKQNQGLDRTKGLKALDHFALVFEYHSDDHGIMIRANFDSRVVKSWMVKRLLQRLEYVISQLVCVDSDRSIADIKLATEQDLEEIWSWNKTVPQAVERCVHEMIAERAQTQPNAPALCAWDGELTYGELNRLSTILASKLTEKGVRPEVLVPLCFEKSMWTTVAILGVLKAGGGFLLLDPSLPKKRLEETVEQIEATMILSSSSTKDISSTLARDVVVINPEFFNGLTLDAREIEHRATPSTTAYVIFTSGSTGIPKGVMISHGNIASAVPQHIAQLGYTKESRIYDFASYSFGASLNNIFSALLSGGCLCVPSDHDRRSNLQQTIASLKANVVLLTPSLAESISPQQVPSLKTIIFGGEAVHIKNVERWWGHVKVITAYGSSECTTISTINANATTSEEVPNIGRGAGLVSWVVDPNNHDKLLAPGCIGELVLEGPAVGQRYLKDPQKTAAVYIRDPEWLIQGTSTHPGRRGRLYKTGDLVQYNEDGGISFAGRKDAQVKLRGQRVELGEVEYRVQLCVPEATQVAAEIITPLGTNSSPELAVFLQMGEDSGNGDSATIIPMTTEIENKLAEYLPRYMIPTVFFSIKELPMTPTGKMNRKGLREIGASFTIQQLAEMRTARQGPKRQPMSDIEVEMQRIWAKVLQIETHTIGLDDSFYQLGGDSIAAMRVVGEARKLGLELAVADIIQHPRLHQIAKRTTIARGRPLEEITPFSLLGKDIDTSVLVQDIAGQCQLNPAFVQDAYPCTPLQEGLLSLSLQRKGDFVMQSILEIPPHVSLSRFKKAWEELVRMTPVLRTRIVNNATFGLVQVVLDESIDWTYPKSFDDYLKADRDVQMDLGQPLTRYAIIEEGVDSKRRRLVWTAHHALYDGYSISLITHTLNQIYQEKPTIQPPGFQNFVRLIKTQDEKKATEYWMETLSGCQSAPFPEVPPSIGQPFVDGTMKIQVPQPQHGLSNYTTSTIMRAAWALVMSETTNSSDIVFGATVFGRNGSVNGIESIVGPTIATIPLRIKLDKAQTISRYMEMVHKQVAQMIPFEHTGLHHIRKMSSSAQQACAFQTLLVVQPQERGDTQNQNVIGQWQDSVERQWLDTYGLVLVVHPQSESIEVTASYDSRVISPWLVQMLLQRLQFVIQQLSKADHHSKVSSIHAVTDSELNQIWEWNSQLHEPVKRCIHDMFEEHAIARPYAPAVHAWDGDLTYRELNEFSSLLANKLIKLGLKPETIVPLCFEKSMWTSVALLGVLKAGGAFVLLDSGLPEQRLKSITKQLETNIILSSRLNHTLSSSLASEVVAVDGDFFKSLDHLSLSPPLPTSHPESTMHLVFTSGSTGTPKGALVSHQNMASTLQHQMGLLQITAKSRIFDFASYAFDVAVYNASAAFSTGACLCVPSEQDRRDRPSESIASLGATVAMITPTVARCIAPEKVPDFQSILFCGEALRLSDVLRWWGRIRVYNTYGPAECTATSVMNSAESPEELTRIGKGAGQLTWIVDPENHNRLMPIGSTGELLLQGPLVGQGYLKDAQKTAVSFIENPDWMLQRGRRGRLYKTGDLVQYTEDGSLMYMGRKDTQVKIRGQRVELGEVEHWVRHYMSSASRAAVEVITPQGANAQPVLASFLQMEAEMGETSNTEPTMAKIVGVPADLDDNLSQHLPSYMVPTVFFAMKQLPIGTTGKLDRKRLREIGASFSTEEISQTQVSQHDKRQPTSEVESRLQKIWSQLLNIDTGMIGTDDSFFKLGGDSISAMQVASAARSESINIRVVDILREKTILNLAKFVGTANTSIEKSSIGRARKSAGSVAAQLSPIQRLYFNLQSDPRTCFDQHFFFELRKNVTYDSLFKAVELVVHRHEALRACFAKNKEGAWGPSRVTGPTESCFVLYHEHTQSRVSEAIRQCREQLDIETGPLVSGVLFDGENGQKLFLAIHHLAVDLMSWRVLLREIETLLTQGTISDPAPIGFGSWIEMQTQFASENLKADVSSCHDQNAHLPFWGMDYNPNLRGGAITKEFALDKSTSSAILNHCNEALGTRPLELMISALMFSFATAFPDRACPQVFTEGHGREVWDDGIDISSIVGWFTTMFPIQIATGKDADLRDTVRHTKDYLRGLSRNGWTYFTSRFANENHANSFAERFPVEILFNYAGSYQQLERADALFKEARIPAGCNPASSLEVRRFSLFEVDMRVDRGHITASIHFHKDMHHQNQIVKWINGYESTMKQLAKEFADSSLEWTLSDFPFAFNSYEHLKEFQRNRLDQLGISAEDVEDIFPCSPMQEGVLLAQSKDPSTYYQWVDVEIRLNGANGRLDETKLQRAWQAVVKRHALLRTILVDKFPGSNRTMHVVIKDPTPNITWDSPTGQTSMEKIQSVNHSTLEKYGLQHRLRISGFQDNTARLQVEMNHAIVDGFSYHILWRDLQKAYNDELSSAGLYKDFIGHLEGQSHDAGREFWTQHLTSVEPCLFPASTKDETDCFSVRPTDVPHINTHKIREFCSTWDVTPATIIQTAWALVLKTYTGSPAPCFGNLCSGRDVPVEKANDIFGPLIGMMPYRVHLSESLSVLHALRQVQQDYLNSLPHQHCPLSEIHRAIGLKNMALFNTVLSYQKNGEVDGSGTSGLSVHVQNYHDPTEYDITLAVTDTQDEISIQLNFKLGFSTFTDSERLVNRISTAIRNILQHPSKPINELSLLTDAELNKIWEWNKTVPISAERSLNEMILAQARLRPQAPAVSAWDGDLTYRELDQYSSKLAHQLVQMGVKANFIVPLCFEKSRWVTVAMLGVMKAGGAFLLLDSTAPSHRLQTIVQQVKPEFIVSSTANKGISSDLCKEVLVFDSDKLNQLPDESTDSPHPSLDTMVYINFTSGSTGTPKGAMVSHRSIASAIDHQLDALTIKSDSRVFDFSSHSFDAPMLNAFIALSAGGCLCIPSEDDRRSNLAGSMARFKVTVAFLTQSVARLLSPDQVPTLKTILVGGEAMQINDITPWWGRVKFISVYGPSECTPLSTINDNPSNPEAAIGLGKGMGVVTWIVDPDNHNALVAPGFAGELLLEGPLIGNGYLENPEKTAASYVNDPTWLLLSSPDHPGRYGRLYKTGDLVQYNDDGSLLFVGRKDTQLKIRGQRVELEEIEYRVKESIPDASQVVVEAIVPQGENPSQLLAAFIQLREDAVDASGSNSADTTFYPVTAEVEVKLAKHLPLYMIPTVFFSMKEFPWTATGKTDRRRLRQIGGSFSAQYLAAMSTVGKGPKRQPTSLVEQQLQTIWANVLNIQPNAIGIDDSFFRLGGDSIAAMKVVGEAQKVGIELAVADIFRRSSIDAVLHEQSGPTGNDVVQIPRSEIDGPVNQSSAQERLWFLERLHPGLTWYLMPIAIQLVGPLQLSALKAALLALKIRHETLRTIFSFQDGVNLQTVLPLEAKELEVIDVTGSGDSLAQMLKKEQTTPFNLETDPGWRTKLYREAENIHTLSIVMHHIISDGWSVDILRKELAIFYSAAIRKQDPLSQLKPLPIRYQDYSVWERQEEQVMRYQEQLDYWVNQLQTSRPAELFCDKPRPNTLSGKAGLEKFMIEGNLYRSLLDFSATQDATPFNILLASFRAAHFRLTGQADATIGRPNANRDRWEVQDMVGFFVNMQCIRIKIEDESFEELIQQVKTTTTDAFANQDVPFESVVSGLQKKRDLSRHPLVQIVFAVHSQMNLDQFHFEGLQTELRDLPIASRFDLEFHFFQETNGLRGEILYSKDLYNPETIQNMLSVFSKVLEKGLHQPTAAVASMSLFGDEDQAALEEMGLLQLNQTEYPRDLGLTDVFRQKASECSWRIAVKDSSEQLSYAELDMLSDVVAGWLKKRSFPAETIVGVFASRSCQTIVAILGILKAGLAYLPLDDQTPQGRLETVLASIKGPKLVLIHSNAKPPSIQMEDVEFVSIANTLDNEYDYQIDVPMHAPGPTATSLAYVIFTSGSTGKPKGVMIEHRSILRLVKERTIVEHVPPGTAVAHVSSIAFDASAWEMYMCLLNGGTLICIDKMALLESQVLAAIFKQEKVRLMLLTPALLKQYLVECPSAVGQLETLYLGGDRLDPQDVLAAQEIMSGTILNAYGPTENSVISTMYYLSKDDQYPNGVPIGRAPTNSGAYVVDTHLNLVPLGVVGELVVVGDGLARGYTDPQRNVNRFVSITVEGKQMRAYRTGDYVRYRPLDGQLEYLGRMDGQIKIRGQRIEVGEIEHLMRTHESVNDAAAILHQVDGQEAQLVGFVTIHDSTPQFGAEQGNNADHSEESNQVQVWNEFFDEDRYTAIEDVQNTSIGRDFLSWTSMYDGTQIDSKEMNEWLDDTIETIQRSGEPTHVLEVGTGSGMILFNLPADLQSYVGLDPSDKAVSFVTKTVKSIPELANKVHMFRAMASDVGRLNMPTSPNFVIINSVAQYFPSLEYLSELVETLVGLSSVKTIYFGDMRSHALYREFLVKRVLCITEERVTKNTIRRMMVDMERSESEFLVDPAFFTSLRDRFPNRIEQVQILPKLMEATNELSCYRFAAVLHLKGQSTSQRNIHSIGDGEWLDFSKERLDHQSLRELVRDCPENGKVAISNIPHSKSIFERFIVDTLQDGVDDDIDTTEWLSITRNESNLCSSLSAVDLVDLAEEVGLKVEISWKRQHSQRGAFDAVFHSIAPSDGKENALFEFPGESNHRPSQALSSHPLRQQTGRKTHEELYEVLNAQLPAYMVPQTITILNEMPVNRSGKVDREALAETAQAERTAKKSVQQPVTAEEIKIQGIWAAVLNVEPETIGLDDNFFQLGGNSIAAMKVTSQARKAGMELAVADIFRYPTIREASTHVTHLQENSSEVIKPFSLLTNEIDVQSLVHDISKQLDLDPGAIFDAYPCTPLQAGLISLSSKQPGEYILQAVMEISPDISIDRFCATWERVARSMTSLHTRIVQHQELGLLQILLDEKIEWVQEAGLDQYLEKDRQRPMDVGQRLTRYALIDDDKCSNKCFVWTVHHALYDGWSVSLLLDAVQKQYFGKPLDPGPQFQSFIKYIKDQDQQKLEDFWQKSLDDCECAIFPALPASISHPIADDLVTHQFSRFQQQSQKSTTSTLIRAAWALITSSMINSTDVIFGVTTAGRSVPIADVDKMVGPTISTVPLRITFRNDENVGEFLENIQQQSVDVIPFEQIGLHRIAQLSPGARQACTFQTLLVIQPQKKKSIHDALGKWKDVERPKVVNTYALTLQVGLGDESIEVSALYDRRVIKPWVVNKLVQNLEFVMQQLDNANPQQPLSQLETVSPHDLSQLWKWNREVPRCNEKCIHEMFEENVKSNPQAAAVSAWDGSLTYAELDVLSRKLAVKLVDEGVGSGVLVPLCFEKSQWTVVSMLAVLKAGGAFVLLDPALPKQRLQNIVEQLQAKLVLSSSFTQQLSLHLTQRVIAVTERLFKEQDCRQENTTELPKVASSSTAYVLFTSGSTGTPKGVVISHQNIASAVPEHIKRLGYTAASRIYDFSSYSFGASINNILASLLAGACLCIPRNDDRKTNLAGSLSSLRATSVLLTPSVAESLSPSLVPDLKTLIFGGEAVRSKDVTPWWGKLQVITAYGSSEITTIGTINDGASDPSQVPNIGKGAGGATWVVDPEDHHRLLPPGCIGELLLEGPLVGIGYLNDSKKTSKAFIENPDWLLRGAPGHPGRHGRVYKTGDLVQYTEDGALTYVGRKDAQVKIRGQRVELGEVEHYVQEYMPEATQVVVEVMTPQGQGSSPLLAAFLQISQNSTELNSPMDAKLLPIPADVEGKLAQQLPSYMAPTVFIAMHQLPMTSTGKMNRRQLREIGSNFTLQQIAEVRTSTEGPKQQPTTEAEKMIQGIWAKVLKIDPETIGIENTFVQLGGDSIAAMKVIGEARQLGLQFTVADLFRHPRLQDLAKQSQDSEEVAPRKIQRTSHSGPIVQSSAQERLWFLDQLYPNLSWYLIPCAIRLRGPIQLDALNIALLALEERHETLRTTFLSDGGSNLQVVHPFRSKPLRVVEVDGGNEDLMDALETDRTTPFNLQTEAGWRASIFKVGENDHVLSIVMHHIISDGWSFDVLRRELANFYTAAVHNKDPLKQVDPLPIQYSDYSIWQKEQDQSEDHTKQLEYWVHQLETSRPAEFLCDKPRPATLSGQAKTESLDIGGDLYNLLHQFCKQQGVTLFTVLLAAFRATHYYMTDASDAAIGTVNANRDQWELKNIIGFFVNMQCLRIKLEGESFKQLVQQVHETSVASFENQDISFDAIVGKLHSNRDLSRHPLVQVIFALHAQEDIGQFNFENTETELMKFSVTSRFDLEFHIFQQKDNLHGEIVFSTDLYNSTTIRSILSVFQKVLEEGLKAPDLSLALLPLPDENEPEIDDLGLVESDRTGYPRDASLIDVFHGHVAEHPDRIAVKDNSTQITYAQLDNQSNLVARWLSKRSLPAETLVGVFTNRSCETIAAFFGVMKANLAYLPFDTQTPMARMDTMLSTIDCQRLILLGSDVQIPATELENVEFHYISDIQKQESQRDDTGSLPANMVKPSATSLAYVIFTSGSTGRPKGVMAEHRGVVRLAKDSNLADHLTKPVVMAHISSLAFDMSTWEIYTALLTGGTLICIDTMMVLDSYAMANAFIQNKVNATMITPALLKQYLINSPELVTGLKTLYVGGERVDQQDLYTARDLMCDGTVLNVYGPTENTSISTLYPLFDSREYVNGVPIGSAVSNTSTFVMDSQQRLVPRGVIGELVLTGDGVARGYMDSRQDKNRFVTVKINGRDVRAYRSGDYVRQRPEDGELEYVGRIDGQVKVLGRRIELGEIDLALRLHASVNDAIAIVKQEEGSEPRIDSFVTLHSSVREQDGDEVDQIKHANNLKQQILAKLRDHLPSYMIPKTITILDHMPVNNNGKIDRRVLAEQAATLGTESELEQQPKRQPVSEDEMKVQTLWSKILRLDPVMIGLDDNFFKLGGDSMGAMKLVALARQSGIQLVVADIFRFDTLMSLASQLHTRSAQIQSYENVILVDPVMKADLIEALHENTGIHPTEIANILPLTNSQEFHVAGDAFRQYCNFIYLDLGSNLDLPRFEQSVYLTLEKFPILRACFLQLMDRWWQVVLRKIDVSLHIEDVDGDLDEYCDKFCLESLQSLSPTSPPVGFFLLRHQSKGTRLILRMSHAQYDGVSMPIIFQSLVDGYYDKEVSSGPDFSEFLSYASTRRPASIEYCSRLLHGSSHTSIESKIRPDPGTQDSKPQRIDVEAEAMLPKDLGKATAATLVSAAWAILLSLITGEKDVTYGHVVAGRNSAIQGIDELVGPCLNIVPIRVNMTSLQTPSELLQFLQDQLVSLGDADSLGFKEMIKHCTDWPAGSDFETVIQYQNVDEQPEIQLADGVTRLDYYKNPFFVPSSVSLMAYPNGDKLQLRLFANTHITTSEMTNRLLGGLCQIIENAFSSLEAPLSPCISDIKLAE